jgi:hypothetical protein
LQLNRHNLGKYVQIAGLQGKVVQKALPTRPEIHPTSMPFAIGARERRPSQTSIAIEFPRIHPNSTPQLNRQDASNPIPNQQPPLHRRRALRRSPRLSKRPHNSRAFSRSNVNNRTPPLHPRITPIPILLSSRHRTCLPRPRETPRIRNRLNTLRSPRRA